MDCPAETLSEINRGQVILPILQRVKGTEIPNTRKETKMKKLIVLNKVQDLSWALSLARQIGGWVEEKYIDDEIWFFVYVRDV